MKKCRNCRYWSEMCAQSIGCGPIEALCLSGDGPQKGKFVPETWSCPKWADNRFGAIDAPPNYGEMIRPLYEALESE
jgi:hypothetical protein